MKTGSKPAARTGRTPRQPKKLGPRQRRGPQQRRDPQQRLGPQTAPAARPAQRPVRAKTAGEAKARAKARKAKAPRVVRAPLRERIAERIHATLAGVDLRPQVLLARVPFVVLVMGALASGLAITLWLSTASAQRSYQLAGARALNDALTQQKEALERDVLQAESAPALADAARELGMIPSKDTAHLVQDPAGNWVVVGKPKPAEGAPPPPMNTKLPDEKPPAPPAPPPVPAPKPGASVEVPRLVGPRTGAAGSIEVPVLLPAPPGTAHAGGGLQLVPFDSAPPPGPAIASAATPAMAAVPNPAAVPNAAAVAVPGVDGVPAQ